jgi:methylated-DNA-[protein]-cysteine S-methyltransferase
MNTVATAIVDSPVGPLGLVANDTHLLRIAFDGAGARDPVATSSHPVFARTAEQLDEFFRNERTDFDLPLAMRGSEFQRAVWDALVEIPYGCTATYGDIAARIGRVGEARAVGAANGANPIPIVVPCHRVIGANGKLTGYGGGLDRKRYLLALEGATLLA